MRSAVFLKDNVNKHSIRAIVAAFEKWFPERDYRIISTNDVLNIDKSSLLFVSFATGALLCYRELSDRIKAERPDINTVCGGPHPSARPEECLKLFDSVCVGEGEISIKDIVLQADDSKATGIIKGKQVLSLDEFPVFPKKHIFLGPIEIVRGCRSRCAYCQTPQLFPGPLRMRSPEMIAEEIKFACSQKEYVDARFIAPDASSYYYDNGVNINAIEKLLKSIKNILSRRGRVFFGTFPSEIDPKGVNKELADLLVKYCDNRLIVLGLQSASERMRRIMKRRSGLNDTENAISIFLERGFEVITDLIFGLPFEDKESYNDTYKFIEKWKGKITIHAHPFDPLPGSPWEYEKPTEVPENLIKLVRSLEGIGKVFGKTVKTFKE